MNWPIDETSDRRHNLRRTPLAQDTQHPHLRVSQDGEELDNLFSPY